MKEFEQEIHTSEYSIYNADCIEVLGQMPDESIDLSVYSPPFAGLYNYSSDERDLSNCENPEQFLEHYEFVVREMGRVTKKGRYNCVHVTDIMNSKTESLYDFPHDVINLHLKHGFEFKARIMVSKEPMKVRLRTMVKSLMHVTMIEDATSCFPAMPDYILIFKKKGDPDVPVRHDGGLKHYFGELPMLPHMLGSTNTDTDDFLTLSTTAFKALQDKYWTFEGDHKENKLSHMIYRRYMDSYWGDVRIDNVLPFRDGRDEDDEKHVHPLQLDVIDRCVVLWSNPGEVVFTPFMGVGSEVFSPVSLGRKGIGVELKPSYFRQAIENMKLCKRRFQDPEQTLFND